MYHIFLCGIREVSRKNFRGGVLKRKPERWVVSVRWRAERQILVWKGVMEARSALEYTNEKAFV